jgi:hypothetical protein
MTENKPTISRGDEYIVVYQGGPNDGRTDKRISTDGGWDTEITILTAVDGKESLTSYNYLSWRDVGGQYFVTYSFDKADSEPVEDPEDRGGRQ